MPGERCPHCGRRPGMFEGDGPGFVKALLGEAGAVWQALALLGIGALLIIISLAVQIGVGG